MRLPDFLVIGAAKSGTTALYDYLRQHPRVAMSELKETNFFALEGGRPAYRGPGDDETINRLSITDLDAYCALFEGIAGEHAAGEASPLYLYDPRVPDRIRGCVPHVKLVAVLRHPVHRAYSAFLHARRDGREPLGDFGEALRAERARIRGGWEHLWHYRAMGFYGRQLERYLEIFPAERIHVLLYDDFVADPVGALQGCFRFLGVDDSFVPDTSMRPNVSVADGDMPPTLCPQLKADLTRSYAADIARLEALLDRDLSAWRRPGRRLPAGGEAVTARPV